MAIEKTTANTYPINGTTALVTGANRGIGRALVDALLARGAAKVYATARNLDSLKDLVATSGGRVVPLQLDVTNPEQIRAAAAAAGDVRLLINNAGIVKKIGGDFTDAAVDRGGPRRVRDQRDRRAGGDAGVRARAHEPSRRRGRESRVRRGPGELPDDHDLQRVEGRDAFADAGDPRPARAAAGLRRRRLSGPDRYRHGARHRRWRRSRPK